MNFKFATVALAGVFILSGCSSVVSLQPFVPEKEAITDPALPGVWIDEQDKETYVIRQSGEAYAITFVEKSGACYRFEGRLWKIGDALMLDLVTANDAPFNIPVHIPLRVWIERESLRMAFLDTEWFKQQVTAKLATQKVNDHTVITATSAAIGAFLQAHAGDDKAHGEPGTLRRAE